jgi:hypothetical protein
LFVPAQSSTRFYSAGGNTTGGAAVAVPYAASRTTVPDWQSAGGGAGKLYSSERTLGVAITAPVVQSSYGVMRLTGQTTASMASTSAPVSAVPGRLINW